MSALEEPHLWGCCYADDDTPPLAAATIYWPGLPLGLPAWPEKQPLLTPYRTSASPRIAGVFDAGKDLLIGDVKTDVLLIDAVPLYPVLGRAQADTPAADQFTISGSLDGILPEMVLHAEWGLLGHEGAREWSGCYAREARLHLHEGLLALETSWIAAREHDMATDSVIMTTAAPSYRGNVAGAITPISSALYKVIGTRSAFVDLAWNSLDLDTYLLDIDVTIKNNVDVMHLANGVAYSTAINHRRQEFVVTAKFALPRDSTDDAEDLIDDLGDASIDSDLVLSVARRHANDYLKMTWTDAVLANFKREVIDLDAFAGQVLEATWIVRGNMSVVDRQVTSVGVAAPNASASYNL